MKNQVEQNRFDILLNRWLLIASIIFSLYLIAQVANDTRKEIKHTKEECMQVLHKHLTGKEVPKDFFEYLEKDK